MAESERQPGRFSGAWQILVNGKKVLSFRGQIDQETANRIGVVKAADRGLYNPGSGDKIKIVPVMLDQKQGVAEGLMMEDPATAFASKAHDEWRQGWIKQNSGKSVPRIKKNSDGSEGDINVPFEKLHPDWQRENLAAGRAAMQAVKQFPNDIEKAAEFIHNEWMKRNPKADYNAAQHVPYDELPESEKEKDRVHVRTMMQLMGKKGMAEGSKEKTPGIPLSKAYKTDFDDKKPGQDRKEIALTGTYSKTGKPGGELKKQGVAKNMDPKRSSI